MILSEIPTNSIVSSPKTPSIAKEKSRKVTLLEDRIRKMTLPQTLPLKDRRNGNDEIMKFVQNSQRQMGCWNSRKNSNGSNGGLIRDVTPNYLNSC